MAEATASRMNHDADLSLENAEIPGGLYIENTVDPLDLQKMVSAPECADLIGSPLFRFFGNGFDIGPIEFPSGFGMHNVFPVSVSLPYQKGGPSLEDAINLCQAILFRMSSPQAGRDAPRYLM